MSQNTTFYILSNIYSISNGQLTLQGINPTSTGVNGSIYIEMYVGGYLSSSGFSQLTNVQPVYLPITCFINNRYVGDNTTMTLMVNR